MVVGSSTRRWNVRRRAKHSRLEGTRKALGLSGKVIPTNKIGMAIDTLVMPGDRVVLEGNNQKQADFLSRALVNVDSERIHDLHMIMPSVSLPEHMDLFEKGLPSASIFRTRDRKACALRSSLKTASSK